jgi:acetyltransferase-like isoleucine patch superfamily enzyme
MKKLDKIQKIDLSFIDLLILKFLKFLFRKLKFFELEELKKIGIIRLLKLLKDDIFRFHKTNFLFDSSSDFLFYRNISFIKDDNVNTFLSFAISKRLYVNALNGLRISSNVLIAPDVKIISANHNLKNFQIYDTSDPITIQKNVWIGANSIILPGVKIGKNSVIAAGSVVNKNVSENSVYAGNPAKLIKKI